MSAKSSRLLRAAPIALLLLVFAGQALAAAAPGLSLPGIDVKIASGPREEVALAVKILVGLTVLSLAPALLVSVTSFVRIIIVLSMLRHAFGMQETPPNTVLVSLALFLTLFAMAPVFEQANNEGLQPYLDGKLATQEALTRTFRPLRGFMIRQTREQDLALMVDLSKARMPQSVEEVGTVQLVPAFMLTELRSAFQIGFVIFLPFLLIDLIVSSILMSLGMMMVPPATISLPMKILMFVLIDGWNLVVKAVLGTIQ
jgi:flagellar biosynthetic protein FliP